MPVRQTPLVTDYYYHIYNRSPHNLYPFQDRRCAIEMVKAIEYYAQNRPPTKLSKRDIQVKKKYVDNFNNRLVDIVAYCVMPNHFHILVKQLVDDGISNYMRRLQSSISHYFNIQNKLKGSIFQGRFQARLIESENHLLHVSRYIHLNPTSAKIVKDPLDYPYTNLKMYKENSFKPPFNAEGIIRGRETAKSYLEFVKDNILYQQELQIIKHELIDEEL